MTVSRVLAAIAAMAISASTVRADDEALMARIRELYEQKDYVGVRRELLAAYERSQEPALLFALGQVEFHLGNYEAAIDYYDRFIATGPGEEQVALAQQAIGAARIRLAQPRQPPAPPPSTAPPPPPPPRRREWYASDTVLVVAGGAAVGLGAGAVWYGRRLGNDRSGLLGEYDDRLARARTYQYTGIGMAAAGALAIGVTLLRWRLRPDDGEPIIATAAVSNDGAAVLVGARW